MSEDQKSLNDKLTSAAAEGQVREVLDLLERGACPDGNNDGKPLILAAYNGRMEVVKILLDAGASAEYRDKDGTPVGNARVKGHREIAEFIENFVLAESPDEVVISRPFRDRIRIMEEIYNFTTLERVSLLRHGRFGAVEAMTITSFSQIEDKSDASLLRQAFNEHVKRGGKTDEALVFPNRLAKNKLPKPE